MHTQLSHQTRLSASPPEAAQVLLLSKVRLSRLWCSSHLFNKRHKKCQIHSSPSTRRRRITSAMAKAAAQPTQSTCSPMPLSTKSYVVPTTSSSEDEGKDNKSPKQKQQIWREYNKPLITRAAGLRTYLYFLLPVDFASDYSDHSHSLPAFNIKTHHPLTSFPTSFLHYPSHHHIEQHH